MEEKKEAVTEEPNKSRENTIKKQPQEDLSPELEEEDHNNSFGIGCGIINPFKFFNSTSNEDEEDNQEDDEGPIVHDIDCPIHNRLRNNKITIDRTTIMATMLENVQNLVIENSEKEIDSRGATWYKEMMGRKIISRAIRDQNVLTVLSDYRGENE